MGFFSFSGYRAGLDGGGGGWWSTLTCDHLIHTCTGPRVFIEHLLCARYHLGTDRIPVLIEFASNLCLWMSSYVCMCVLCCVCVS